MGYNLDAALEPADRTLLSRRGGVARLPEHYEALSTGRDIRPVGDPPHATNVRAWHGEYTVATEFSGTPIESIRARRHLGVYAHWLRLLLPLQGTVDIEQGGRRHEVHPGEMGSLVPDQGYRWTMSNASRLLLVHVSERSLRPAGLPLEDLISQKWGGGVMIPALSVLLQGLLECRAEGSVAGSEDSLVHLITNIVASEPEGLLRAHGNVSLPSRLRELIRARFHDPQFTVDVMAKELGVSRRSLYGLFAPQGLSVGAMLREHRVNRGAFLIRTSPELSLGQVATLCGFQGRDQFSRAFKASFGMTPTEFAYRRAEAATRSMEPPEL